MPTATITDTTLLSLPTWLDAPERHTVSEQRVTVSARWWNARLEERGLPGGPLRVQRDQSAEFLTRSDVWQVAASSTGTDESVLSLLWHALAWGAGTKSVRNEGRRMDAVAADPAHAAELLRRAGGLASTHPEAAYSVLHPYGRGVLTQLGPAFGTKYLYFAGAGEANHPAVILDARAARALGAAGWRSLRPSGSWPAMTYGRYCALARRWAEELSQPGAPVGPDQVEYALFQSQQSRVIRRQTLP